VLRGGASRTFVTSCNSTTMLPAELSSAFVSSSSARELSSLKRQ
jgi:hypothetical protein